MATDFTDSIHPAVADYRKRLAERGLFDDKDDYQVVRFLAQKNPALLDQDPSFGELYGKIREANAPSLGAEAGRAFKRAGIGLGETALAAGTLATDSDFLRRKTAALGMMASDPDLAPTIPTIDEIRSPRDAVRYAASKVGEVVPSLAESVAVAGVGALAGTAAAPGPGTAAGAVGGAVAKAAAKAAIRKAALRGGMAANAANSYALSSGEIYNETDDRGLALGLGAVAAIPDTILPSYVLSKFLPDVPKELVKEEGKKFLARLATEGLKTSGIEASTESFQEAVNIVARNLKEERDPLAFDDEDLVRIREAGITGAFAGGLVAPATAMGRGASQDEEEIVPVTPAPPAPPAATVVPPAAVSVTALPSQRVRAMSPEAQVARLAELQTRARVGDEEAEFQILLQTVPREAVPAVTPEVVEAVAAGNLPLAPTITNPDAGIGETVLPEGRTPVDEALAQIQPPAQDVPAPASVPIPAAAQPPAVEAPAPVAPILPPSQPAVPVVSLAGETPSPVVTPDMTPRQQYDAIQGKLKELGPEKFGTPEYQALWKASEEIKNRNKGMPPGESSPPVAGEEAPTITPESLPDANKATETVWYHGTGANLETDKIASTWTKMNSLFGTGFYLTDNPEIANSYGKNRGGKGGKTYAVRVAPRAVLNLELPMTEAVAEVLGRSVYDDFKDVVTNGLAKKKTTAQVISDLREAVADQSQGDMIPESEYGQMFQEIEGNFREAGIDAFTHVGGTRAGKGKKLHRVLIMLDPSNEFGVAGAQIPKTVLDVRDSALPAPTPAAPEAPRQQYDAIQAELKKLGVEKFGTPEYQALWKASEEIKNRNKGMPPGEVSGAAAQSPELMSPDEFSDNYESTVKGGNLRAAFRVGDKLIEGGPEIRSHGQMYDPKWGNNAEATFTWKGKELDIDKIGKADSAQAEIHRQALEFAAADRLPVSATAVDAYGVKLPEGYAKQGDRYVYSTPAPPRPSPEQRLNDAGADLPPVSSLSRAQKRAELDAAGVTTYNGKPLDQANPAEISNAVGKLRRGELDAKRSISPNESIDPGSPATLQFRDASSSEVSGERRKVLTAFEQRYKNSNPGSRLTFRPALIGGAGVSSKAGSFNRYVENAERALGKQIVFFTPSDNSPAPAGAVLPDYPGILLVNTKARDTVAVIIGHEYAHSLERTNPELYAPIKGMILEMFPVTEENRAQKVALGYGVSEVESEHVAEILADRFGESDFWRELGRVAESRGQGSVFRDFVEAALQWMERIGERFFHGLSGPEYDGLRANIAKIQTALASAIVDSWSAPPPSPRTTTEPSNPAVQAQRTQEFQAVMGRLVANGANVQAFSQELLAQQTGEIIQQQLAALQQRLAAATTAPQRNELQKQIAVRQERMQEIAQMRGVTYSPYHIAVAMDDVANASLDNLVTLLHEAAESLTMRLSPAQQGAVFRAVEATTAQMQARMQAAAKNTGATVANVPVPSELLAETMAQALAAEGIPESTSLAQAIARWIKEIYYRVAMAAQRSFGGEPSPEMALGWYENQLRRELGGDYEYSFANLLDRLLPQPNSNFTSKFTGATGTPGGMPDFFDPTTQKTEQPWVEPTSDAALQWNMRFQTVPANIGESEGIPADEAVARQTAAAYNEQIKWLTKLHDDIAPAMDMQEFLGLVSRGEKTPHEMLDALKTAMPGVESAVIGGERMTDAMNKWAAHQTLDFMKGVQGKHLTRIAQMQESVKDADERFTEHAAELNRLEPDVRNAELHEGELRKKVRTIIEGLLASYKNGIRTSSKLGMMVEAEENLGDRDPLPQFYAQAFANLLNADVPLFDYVEAIAMLDLPVLDMTPEEIWAKIRENADTSPMLRELSRNKPLVMTLSVLAKNNARQLDQIQLRRADADTFLDIRKELAGIRNATEAQLREMLKTIDDKNEAKGLRQRIKTAYLKERRALKRASERIALVEERIDVLEKAKPAVAEKIGEMQQAIGGVFSEWTPADGAELTVMRRDANGDFQKATRTLEFNKDGSAVDSAGILNDLAQNQQWLKANVARAGQKEYETVKHQTRAMQMMDVQRAYQSHNYGKVIGFIDAFVRPLQAIAKQAGHSVGNRIVQQFNKYEFINRSGAKALQNQSYEWGAAMNEVMKSLGLTDVGQFRAQIYNPVKFWLGVNPGLDQAQAIRGAVALARKQSPKTPAANFNAKFEAFLLKDKEIEDELLRTAESNGVLVWDEKLGELRKAIARGWSTGMRMMNDGVVATLVHDMEKAGWKLEFDKDEAKKSKKVVTRSSTFDALNPANATDSEERAEYYKQLENTDALRAALKPYFTPGIIERWLLPFINKPGEPVFNHAGRDISQLDLQNAWAKAGGDVLNWIDILGQSIEVTPEEDASAAATFRWDMLRQLEHLFKWEAGMAYEAEQTPDLFSNQGTKLHVMMDARVNDLLPAEHVNFAMHDPTSVRQMLGQIAFHGAFGRNGAALMTNLKELEAVSVAKKFAFDGLRSTTVEGRKREAREKGFDYNDLKRAVDHYHDVLELKGEIESAMGVKNIYGPLYDARAGMELLGFMVGQVVDQPKTGALNFLSIGARPFAMHSFSPKVLKATALAYGDLAKNTFGNMLRDFGIDIIRMSDFAKETGEVEGKAFRRLPYGVVLSGDPGKNGSFQDSLSSRFLVQPLRIFRALQKKGVGPGIAAIPGLGTMQRFATEGAMANIRGQTYLLQEIINNGIRHFSAHPEDLSNPAFRFDQNSLKLKGDRGMYDWFRNKTVEYNMGPIENIVREAIQRQAAGERIITTEMVEQLAQMNAQELDGASSINTAPAGLAQNQALRVALPLLRWPLWMMHAAHEGLADANGRLDFKSMMAGLGRLAAWNLPLGLAFTFMIDEYDEKILKKKNALPSVSPLAAIPVAGVPLALATSPRSVPQELLGIGQRMIRSGNIYGLGADMIGALATPFDPGSGQRAFSLDQRVLIMSQFLNLTQAISNMVNQGGTATWGSVYRPLIASIGGNGMLNSLDVVNNLAGLDNAESRLTQRINAARWVNTAAKELEIETRKASGFSSPSPMSVWTREMQLAAMANSRADFMDAYRKALEAARERVAEDDRIKPQDREKEAVARVLASWRSRNPFSGLASAPTPEQIQAMLSVMNEQGRTDVRDAMRYYDAYTQLIKPSEMEQYMNRRMQAMDPMRQMESMRRRAAAGMMSIP